MTAEAKCTLGSGRATVAMANTRSGISLLPCLLLICISACLPAQNITRGIAELAAKDQGVIGPNPANVQVRFQSVCEGSGSEHQCPAWLFDRHFGA